MHSSEGPWQRVTLCVILTDLKCVRNLRQATLPTVRASLSPSCLQTARLRDGALVTVRSVRPSDRDAMRAAFGALSAETRYRRFHAHVSELPGASWSYLTQVDGHHHVALVALLGGRIVGVARFIRLAPRPERAEIAFVIADLLQRRGLGRVLRAALLDRARALGVTSFQASVLPDSLGIRRLLQASPLALVSDTGDRLVLRFAAELKPAAERPFQ